MKTQVFSQNGLPARLRDDFRDIHTQNVGMSNIPRQGNLLEKPSHAFFSPTILLVMPPEPKENIFRTLRLGHKVTQAVAADALGISRSHLANIEKGNDLPGRNTLMAAADFYNVSLDWLTQRAHAVSGEDAKAKNEREALWLGAFRQLPDSEADHILGYILARTAPPKN